MCAGHYPRYSLDHAGEVALARRRAAASLSAALRAGVSRYVLTSLGGHIGPPRPPARSRVPTIRWTPVRSRASTTPPNGPSSARLARRREGARRRDPLPDGRDGGARRQGGTGFLLLGVATRAPPISTWKGAPTSSTRTPWQEAHLRAAERGTSGARYLVAGHNVTIGDLPPQWPRTSSAFPCARAACPARQPGCGGNFDERRVRQAGAAGAPRADARVRRHGSFSVSGSTARASAEALGLGPVPPLADILRQAIA